MPPSAPNSETVGGRPVTDDGRRLAAAVLVARAVGGEGRWIAARLSDGSTDGTVYDTRDDAIRHQAHETQCAYLVVPPAPMPPVDATAYLELHRRMYAGGYRLQDPGGVTRATIQQQMAQLVPNRADRRRRSRPAGTRSFR